MSADASGPTSRAPLALSFMSFVSLGLPDGLLGVAWPSMRTQFQVPLDMLGAIYVAATAGYVGASLVAPRLLSVLGVGRLLTLSCAASAVALVGYALAPVFSVLIALAVLSGAGGGAIDAGLNVHAALYYQPRTVNLLHACYGIGTMLGPLVITLALGAGASWQVGYLAVGTAQLLLTLTFAATRGRWPAATPAGQRLAETSVADSLRSPRVQLSMLTFFIYVGLEAGAGAWMYSLLHESRGLGIELAGAAMSLYWAGLFAGRVAFALLPIGAHPARIVGPCVVVGAACAALLWLDAGPLVDLLAAAALGFGSGPIFPSLICTTPARVGAAHTVNAVGLQIGASALGIAILPACFGVLAGGIGLRWFPGLLFGCWLLLVCSYLALQRSTVPWHDDRIPLS